jgi:hypothetical protein
MPLQASVGYTISYDKETGKLVLEIFDLKKSKKTPHLVILPKYTWRERGLARGLLCI